MTAEAGTVRRALQVSAGDNVATLLVGAGQGDRVLVRGVGEGAELQASSPIPFGHKIALVDLAEGESVVKYGQCIGCATTRIAAGEHVHVHNLVGVRGRAAMQGLEGAAAALDLEGSDHT